MKYVNFQVESKCAISLSSCFVSVAFGETRIVSLIRWSKSPKFPRETKANSNPLSKERKKKDNEDLEREKREREERERERERKRERRMCKKFIRSLSVSA